MSTKCLREGRLSFDFREGTLAYKADNPTLNALGGVDFVIELEDKFIFVEVKDVENKNAIPEERAEWVRELKIEKKNPFLRDMGVKFKDTVLRRWANGEELDKPIWYIVLLELNSIDAVLRSKLSENLMLWLPNCINKKYGFKKELCIKRREILNIDGWKKKFPEFPIQIVE